IHTSEPLPNLWDAIGREPLVPREYTVKNGVEALNERPVGTGPREDGRVEAQRLDALRAQRELLGLAPALQAAALPGHPRGGRAPGRPPRRPGRSRRCRAAVRCRRARP